ncbi:MAG: hypothetical protein IPF69_04155 [Chitinophagaceae bacterium]|jgi:tellurite resistance protein TehA-like permease|nr:hypothetical protein [Chitinophagaceae bacterium]MBK7677970.1 hypothetical protein [Chitinophagaceae bacterium]MBK8301285.1 hypothetical protein [Chitinophagaceae bacterium]MBK9466195.1 hypothetical protein [Chitinophagaceae bacterium]MBP6234199.1 hypothetical protein [Chitinophagaceae bacterium]
MERNWDPEVKKFFTKILNSIAMGLFWLIACLYAGIYQELGYTAGKPLIYTVLFYVGMAAGLFFLLRYLYKAWKKE